MVEKMRETGGTVEIADSIKTTSPSHRHPSSWDIYERAIAVLWSQRLLGLANVSRTPKSFALG